MTGAVKAGWFLLGLGVGVLGTTIIFKRELEKPIADDEEYIPLRDREKSLEVSGETSKLVEEDSGVLQTSEENYISSGSGRGRRDVRGQGGDNDRKEDYKEFSTNQSEVLNYYQSFNRDDTKPKSKSKRDKRRKEFDEQRGEGKSKTKSKRYSRMYQDEVVEEALHVVNSRRGSRDSYNMNDEDIYDDADDYPLDDDIELPEFERDIHDEFTLERVEDNIEVFLDDNPQDFITLVFYEGDNTLCDDGEQIIPNAEDVVGLAALSRLIEGGPGAENGVIFVHNLKTSLNYEVVLDAGSYQDTVIGQFESRHDRDGGRGGNT